MKKLFLTLALMSFVFIPRTASAAPPTTGSVILHLSPTAPCDPGYTCYRIRGRFVEDAHTQGLRGHIYGNLQISPRDLSTGCASISGSFTIFARGKYADKYTGTVNSSLSTSCIVSLLDVTGPTQDRVSLDMAGHRSITVSAYGGGVPSAAPTWDATATRLEVMTASYGASS